MIRRRAIDRHENTRTGAYSQKIPERAATLGAGARRAKGEMMTRLPSLLRAAIAIVASRREKTSLPPSWRSQGNPTREPPPPLPLRIAGRKGSSKRGRQNGTLVKGNEAFGSCGPTNHLKRSGPPPSKWASWLIGPKPR